MTFDPDPRLSEAKQLSVEEVVSRLGIHNLRRTSGELIGPCPLCGGRDRFGINLQKKAFLCRKCDLSGGDMVSLTEQVLGLDFKGALAELCGEVSNIDQAERARREKRAKELAKQSERKANRYRLAAIEEARSIWARSLPGNRGVVRAYLLARGIDLPQIPDCLRFILDHPYGKGTDYRGPCMIAGVFDMAGVLQAVHQTWVDSHPPHGKASVFKNGERQPSKLVRGSKKGHFIPLRTPKGAKTLVMGEGIETTLSVLAARVPGLENAAFWAGVDLGNMSGRMLKIEGKRYSGLPDMADAQAFVPPPWVERFISIQDGDSNPQATRAKLEAGLIRAQKCRPSLVRAEIVSAPKGYDMNDVLAGALNG